ncbi:LppU/SCO3897 family protein [Catenuloplanes atrovinosus]|uniref:Uncharacterized protein n=1 Tax=Catenuloplanes atrovinosus TaxID=137266 RepID=A0AAE3YU93_9ACTN|nr:hypothetical protein [Catenuloplanes atrovinosus]MDR7279307.1 hypothetical protein [Catenuloplanes atrovinosus]
MTDQPAGYPPPQPSHTPGFGAPLPGAPQGQPQPGMPGTPGMPPQGYGAGSPQGYGAGSPQGYGAGSPQGYGAAPQQGYGAAPYQQPAFGAPGYVPPVQEPKKGGGKARLAGILGVIGVVGVGILIKVVIGLGAGAAANALSEDPTKDAKVGQCLDDTPELAEGEEGTAVGVSIVDCGDADATSLIVGRVDHLTLTQARAPEACFEFINEGESVTVLYTPEDEADKYYILCLKDQ